MGAISCSKEQPVDRGAGQDDGEGAPYPDMGVDFEAAVHGFDESA